VEIQGDGQEAEQPQQARQVRARPPAEPEPDRHDHQQPVIGQQIGRDEQSGGGQDRHLFLPVARPGDPGQNGGRNRYDRMDRQSYRMIEPKPANECEYADEFVPRPFILAHQLGVERQNLDEAFECAEPKQSECGEQEGPGADRGAGNGGPQTRSDNRYREQQCQLRLDHEHSQDGAGNERSLPQHESAADEDRAGQKAVLTDQSIHKQRRVSEPERQVGHASCSDDVNRSGHEDPRSETPKIRKEAERRHEHQERRRVGKGQEARNVRDGELHRAMPCDVVGSRRLSAERELSRGPIAQIVGEVRDLEVPGPAPDDEQDEHQRKTRHRNMKPAHCWPAAGSGS